MRGIGHRARRGRSIVVGVLASLAVIVLAGCAARDDSVSGRVGILHSEEWAEEDLLEMRGVGSDPPEPRSRGISPVADPVVRPIVTPAGSMDGSTGGSTVGSATSAERGIATVLDRSLGSVPYTHSLRVELEFLRPIVGPTWIGHYANEEDSHLEHVVRWEPALQGQAVRATKHVEGLDFSSETLYHWDPQSQDVAFVSITNRGQLSRGVARLEDGRVVLDGQQMSVSGAVPYRRTYEVLPDGTLTDRFYLEVEGQWVERHVIVHFRR